MVAQHWGISAQTVPQQVAQAPPPGAADGGLQDIAVGHQQLEQAHQANPNDPQITLQLGNTYYDSAQWEKARTMYEIVLPLKPTDPNLLTDLGVTYRSLGQADKALELFERAAKADPMRSSARSSSA